MVLEQVIPAKRVIEEHGDLPVFLEKVYFDDIERTKNDALAAEVGFLFKATSLRDLVVRAYEAKKRMERDGLFDQVFVVLKSGDSAPSKLIPSSAGSIPSTKSSDTVFPVIVDFVASEPQLVHGKVNVGVTNIGEGYVGSDVALRSVFGRGERLTGSLDVGKEHSRLANLSFIKPLLGGRETRLGFHLIRNYFQQPWSSLFGVQRGLAFDVTHKTFCDSLEHVFRVEFDWRQLGCLSKATAFAVREQTGHSLKSSIKNILVYSTLDSVILPRRGFMARASQEIAGMLGFGDVNLLKHDVLLKCSTPLFEQFFLTAGFQASYVYPRESYKLSLFDRAYLGGPTDLRGFGYCGIGPMSDGAFVGGMASWAAALHLYRPLIPRKFLFAHAFGVMGNICPFSPSLTNQNVLQKLGESPRCTLGVGLAVKVLSMARIELNYCWPFTNHPTDLTQPGFQFGIGFSFL